MITVEKIKEKARNASAEIRNENEELIKTGVVKKKNSNLWLWILGIGALAVGGYLLFKDRKGKTESGTNTGISG